MAFKIGDKYICTETTGDYWTVGKEYPVQLRTGTNPCIVDDEGIGWYQDTYEMYATFKLNEEENKMKFKLGETYICTKSSVSGFTTGKEYPVLVNDFGKLAIRDDEETTWFDYELSERTTCFKLKGVTETPDQKATKEEPTIYTKTEVIRQIAKAYQQFDNDPQRLAYLTGYFAK